MVPTASRRTIQLHTSSTQQSAATRGLARVTEQCSAGCSLNGGIPNLIYRSANWGHSWDAQYTWRASLSYVTGAHNLKIGYGGVALVSDLENHTNDLNLLYTVNNGVPISLQQTLLPYTTSYRTRNMSFYVQDQWTHGRLSVQGALRFDRNWSFSPEQQIPASGLPGVDWESCMTMNDTWGFKSYDDNWKSSERLIRNLVDIVSKGGNYLLNVGPTPQGTIPAASVERLAAMGQWMKVNSEAIYGTTASPFSTQLTWGRATRKGNTLYLHVFDWPVDATLKVPSIGAQPTSASLLGSDASLKIENTADGFFHSRPGMRTVSTIDELEKAADVVYRAMTPTPQQRWPLLDQRCGAAVWVKHENHTPIGAFKVRGGLVYLDDLRRREPHVAGIVAATRGNHGQSVAFAASRHGMPTAVIAPHGNSIGKNNAMRALGAELIEEGHDFQASLEAAERLAASRGWHMLPSFHPLLVQGAATYSLELLRAVATTEDTHRKHRGAKQASS